MSRHTIAMLTVNAVLALCLAAPADSSAGTYEVNACRLPSGAAAPAAGWATTSPWGPGATSAIDCPGGAMTSTPNAGGHNKGDLLGFVFSAPPGTTIAGYRRQAEGVVQPESGAPPSWVWEYGEYGTLVGASAPVTLGVCGNCGGFTAGWDMTTLSYRLTNLYSALTCDPQSDAPQCQANGSHFALRWISVRLEDLSPPRIMAAKGSLLTGGSLTGERFLGLSLHDVGGGLLKTRVEVDGQRFSEQTVPDSRGTCRTPFVSPVPCPLATDMELPIDTTRIPDGRHQVLVRAFDATGSNSATFGPISIDVDNVADAQPPRAFSCAASTAGRIVRRPAKVTAGYGRPITLSGRIAGAPLNSVSRVTAVDSAGQSIARRVRIRKGGRFRINVRPPRSVSIRPVLLGSAGYPVLCGAATRVSVRAGIRFTVAPRRLRNGETIAMRGRLVGLPVPPSGKSVVLQARARGSHIWTSVTELRTRLTGRFSFRYRFRRTFARTTYEFRAVAPRQRDYPFGRGWSPVQRAVVRP